MAYREENSVRKGEIACNNQFLLFSQCFFYNHISLLRQNVALCDNGLKLWINPFQKRQILKEFAEDNFIRDENGRKFSNREKNTVGKGQIAHYEGFLFLPQCFQKTKTCTAYIM